MYQERNKTHIPQMSVIFCLFKQKHTYVIGIGYFFLKLLQSLVHNINAINFKFVNYAFEESTNISGQEYGTLHKILSLFVPQCQVFAVKECQYNTTSFLTNLIFLIQRDICSVQFSGELSNPLDFVVWGILFFFIWFYVGLV